jgi:hypothetical protein
MKPEFAILALACAFTESAAPAQDHSGSYLPFNLAPAEAASSNGGGSEEDEKAELAKKLQNPAANLVSVPIQNNRDFGIGPAVAMHYTTNTQSVIPVTLTKDFNHIVQTILPVGPDWGLRFVVTLLFKNERE